MIKFLLLFLFNNSSEVIPVMKATKLGIIGKIHGDRKLKIPAKNAIGIPIVVILLLSVLVSVLES